MSSNVKRLGGVIVLLLAAAMNPSRVEGANAYPLITDPNVDGLAFGATDVFSFGGAYSINDDAVLTGNDVLSVSQFGTGGGTGAGFSVPVSNGENGIDQSFDGLENQDLNTDAPNTTAPNSVFAAIGNPSGKLENGNVVRFSAWYRSDPANPITVDPQIQPVLKFEFWKEALSTNQDTAGGQTQTLFGDKVYDQDQHGGAQGINAQDRAQWIDFDGDGIVIDGDAAPQGRVSQISTGAWTLVESMYTVNDASWEGIADDIYDVGDIEEVRSVMFVGDFAGTDLSGGGDGGNLLVDNILVEFFRNAAAVTPNTNPNPDAPAGVLGDYNNNDVVDAADYVVWRNGGPLANEGASIGVVNQADYEFWRAAFGNVNNGAGAVAGVPEPASCALAALASLAATLCLRRHRS